LGADSNAVIGRDVVRQGVVSRWERNKIDGSGRNRLVAAKHGMVNGFDWTMIQLANQLKK